MHAQPGRILIGRFHKDEDLLNALTDLCRQEKIEAGQFSLIGSVSAARFGYYNQVTQRYIEIHADERWEIAQCCGNLSAKDGNPSVHAHVVFADDQGRCYGGHLLPGTKIFVAEYYIQELREVALMRHTDPETGLALWP